MIFEYSDVFKRSYKQTIEVGIANDADSKCKTLSGFLTISQPEPVAH